MLLQTIHPDHYAVQCAAAQNYELFYEKELHFRRALRYPPFATLANVLVRHAKQEEALRMSAEIGRLLTPVPEHLRMLGPAEAPVSKLKSEFRYQLLIKAARRPPLRAALDAVRRYAHEEGWPATALVIDVDPLSLQ